MINSLKKQSSEDLNLTVRYLDSIETAADDTNPQYYFQVMKTNLQTIEAGCN